MCRLVRKIKGKKPTPSAGILDSQSMDTTEVGGEERGDDAAKNVKGRKRHIMVDTLGLIMAIGMTPKMTNETPNQAKP